MHLRLKLLIVLTNLSQDFVASQVLRQYVQVWSFLLEDVCTENFGSDPPELGAKWSQNVAVIVHVFLRDDVKFKAFILAAGICYITFVLSHLL